MTTPVPPLSQNLRTAAGEAFPVTSPMPTLENLEVIITPFILLAIFACLVWIVCLLTGQIRKDIDDLRERINKSEKLTLISVETMSSYFARAYGVKDPMKKDPPPPFRGSKEI